MGEVINPGFEKSEDSGENPESVEEGEQFERMTGKELFLKAKEIVVSETGFETGFLPGGAEGAFRYGADYVGPELSVTHAYIAFRYQAGEGLGFQTLGKEGYGGKDDLDSGMEFKWNVNQGFIKVSDLSKSPQDELGELPIVRSIRNLMESEMQVPKGFIEKLTKVVRMTKEALGSRSLVRKDLKKSSVDQAAEEEFKKYLG